VADPCRNDITDEGLVMIGECFKELKLIEVIKLELEDCKEITEEGKDVLKKNLEEIASLKRLKFEK